MSKPKNKKVGAAKQNREIRQKTIATTKAYFKKYGEDCGYETEITVEADEFFWALKTGKSYPISHGDPAYLRDMLRVSGGLSIAKARKDFRDAWKRRHLFLEAVRAWINDPAVKAALEEQAIEPNFEAIAEGLRKDGIPVFDDLKKKNRFSTADAVGADLRAIAGEVK